MVKPKNRYTLIIESIFSHKYKKGDKEVLFERNDLVQTADKLGISLPKNLGDVLYSFRYRACLPESIKKFAPEGLEWVIRPIGKAKYKFSLFSGQTGSVCQLFFDLSFKALQHNAPRDKSE